MHAGHYISGFTHFSVLSWALLGSFFQAPPEQTPDVVTVSVISPDAFAALTVSDQQPSLLTEIDQVDQTEMAVESQPEAPKPFESSDERPQTPQMAETVVGETQPDPPEALRISQPDLDSTIPDLGTPSVEDFALLSAPKRVEAPQNAKRIAAVAIAPPEPETRIDADTSSAKTPIPSEDVTEREEEIEKEDPVAEPETATEVTPEPQNEIATAPKVSLRPKSRPAPVQNVQNETTPSQDTESAAQRESIAAAVENVVNQDEAAAPSGPPLTGQEEDGLKRAIGKCWNVDTGNRSSDVIVTVSVELSRDGKVKSDTLKMIDGRGGSATAIKSAFEKARRAILICGRNGYDLPQEKYDHWDTIEITFDPKKMRKR